MKHCLALIAILFLSSTTIFSQAFGTVSANEAEQGEILTVTITGINTSWGQETGTFWTVIGQNSSTTIVPIVSETVISTTEIELEIHVPFDQVYGDYDVWRNDLVLENGFTISCDLSEFGCNDPTACNFVPSATCNLGTCIYPGCTDPDACNYDSIATCDDGGCLYGNWGCTDPDACNFDPTAGCDDGNCNLGDYFGCTHPHAFNYNYLANCDDGTCLMPEITSVTPNVGENGQNLSVTITGLNTRWGQESGTFTMIIGQQSSTLMNITNQQIVSMTEITADVSIPEDAGWGDYDVFYGHCPIVYAGFSVFCPGGVGGCTNVDACNFNSTATCEDGSCVYPGCLNSVACNYEEEAGCDNGTCLFGDTGCMDSNACNFLSTATCDDGDCFYNEGCTNYLAVNYDLSADCDDGSCIVPEIISVTPNSSPQDNQLSVTITGLNTSWGQESGTFWTMFTQNSSTLITILEEEIVSLTEMVVVLDVPLTAALGDYDVWRGNAILNDGFTVECAGGELGCTDPVACNYSSTAACSDGTCFYPGCMDSAACNYNANAGCDDGSCNSVYGCTDPDASNYNSLATCYDVSCVYSGCTEIDACNYDYMASIDDGSCIYGISGTIFNDIDQDGFQSVGEAGIENWTVQVQPLNITAFTGADGLYYLELPAGDYAITAFPGSADWIATSPSQYNLTIGTCSDVDFAFASSNSLWSYQTYPTANDIPGIHCDLGYNAGIWFHNNGTEAISGAIVVEFPALFDAEAIVGQLAPDYIDPDQAVFTIEDLLPGQSVILEVHILGVGPDYLGSVFDFTYGLTLVDYNGLDVFEQSFTVSETVLCSYDPNDKTGIPFGYGDEHLVNDDQRIEYKVRFQNTGNYLAQNVIVKDTLSTLFDWSTFNPLYSSHEMTTSFELETGAAEFIFENIYLPDSTSNEPESHGYVVYEVFVNDSLDPGSVINNTAYIFFDGNEAIITNTAFHTIYDCSLFEVSFEFDTETGFAVASEGDAYQWYLNGEAIEGATEQEYQVLENGLYSVQVEIGFPCSLTSAEEFILVTGIEGTIQNGMSVYPNPAQNEVHIDFDRVGDYTIKITGEDGRLIDTRLIEDQDKCVLELSTLNAGMYILHVNERQTGEVFSKLIVVQR